MTERIEGPMGSAEPVTMRRARKDQDATVAAWLIESRRTGLPWWQFGVSVASLAPMDGVPPAHKWFPEATHELIVLAYDPKTPSTPDNLGPFLQPASYAAQFVTTDENARELVPQLVRLAVDGRLHLEPKPTASTIALAANGQGPWLEDRRDEWAAAISRVTGSRVQDQWRQSWWRAEAGEGGVGG